MFGSDGRWVIDVFSQMMATILDHGIPIVADEMQKQDEEVVFLNTIKIVHRRIH